MSFREYLSESMSDEFIMQKLADSDINSKIENKVVLVDKDDIANAKKVLKSIHCEYSVKAIK